jgi:hypothetical protein
MSRIILCGLLIFLEACYHTQGLTGDTSIEERDTYTPDTATDPTPDPPRPDGPSPDAADVPPDEDPWPCIPTFPERPVTVLGGLHSSVGDEGDPDHPDLITLDSGEVWLISRIVNSPGETVTPKLTLVMVYPPSANPGGTYYHPVTHVELDSTHPMVPFGDSLAIVHQDRGDFSANEILYRILEMPPESGELGAFSGTDHYSSQPAAASSGTGLCAAWRQEHETGPITIEFGIVDEAGTLASSGTASVDSGDEPLDPMVVYNGSGYGILYLMSTAGPFAMAMAQLEEDGSPSPVPWAPIPAAEEGLTGRPAVAWDGSRYAILFEGSVWGEAAMHFVRHRPDGGGSGTTITEGLKPTTGAITDPLGMLDMVWTGSRYGVVWAHLNPTLGSRIWFFEMDIDGDVVNGPHLLNPDATQSFNPAITWIKTDTMRYYVFAWDEFSDATAHHVLYTYSYGCRM